VIAVPDRRQAEEPASARDPGRFGRLYRPDGGTVDPVQFRSRQWQSGWEREAGRSATVSGQQGLYFFSHGDCDSGRSVWQKPESVTAPGRVITAPHWRSVGPDMPEWRKGTDRVRHGQNATRSLSGYEQAAGSRRQVSGTTYTVSGSHARTGAT